MESARNFESNTVPDVVFHGYMACVTNEYAASDGDFVSYFFRNKAGAAYWMRTWGGVRAFAVIFSDGWRLHYAPEFSLYGTNSEWLIENHGVAPDIEVDNRPDLVMQGREPAARKSHRAGDERDPEAPKKLPRVR